MSTTPSRTSSRASERLRRHPLAVRLGIMAGGFALLAPVAAMAEGGFTLTTAGLPGAVVPAVVPVSKTATSKTVTRAAETETVAAKASTAKPSTVTKRSTYRRYRRYRRYHRYVRPVTKPASTAKATPPTTAKPVVVAPKPAVVVAVPAPAPAAPPAAMTTKDQIVAAISSTFPAAQLQKALFVVNRESKFTPSAYNGICCYGLFQINFSANRAWLATQGVTSASQLFDAATNIRVAYAMWLRSGWGPWGG